MTKTDPFTAAVVGLGRIGMGYDYDAPSSSQIQTHAQAFHAHPGFTLVGAVDPDESRRRLFFEKFKVEAYASLDALMAATSVDVFAIATPTANHLALFRELAERNPRAIVCEKPLASSIAEAKEICEVAEARKIPVLVNYMRTFEPGVQELHRALKSGEFGEIYKGVAWYSKGVRNSGSHLVDLLRYLLGDPDRVEIRREDRSPRANADSEPDFQLVFPHAEITFLAVNRENKSMIECELEGSAGRIRYLDSGNKILVQNGSSDWREITTDLRRYQWHVVDALFRSLTTGETWRSSARHALETLSYLEGL